MSAKRKASCELTTDDVKRNKMLDQSYALKRLLPVTKSKNICSIMVELRRLGKRALGLEVILGLMNLWKTFPDEVIFQFEKHLMRRNIEAVTALLWCIDNYARIIDIPYLLGEKAKTVFLCLPVTRLPITRFCHFAVGLASVFRNNIKIGKFIEKRLLLPCIDQAGEQVGPQVVLLNSSIVGEHAVACGNIVLKFFKKEKCDEEMKHLFAAVALSTLNIALAFNDAVICQTKGSKTQIFMDYAGESIDSDAFSAGLWHTTQTIEGAQMIQRSIIAQICMGFYTLHRYTGCIHADAHYGNITVTPWPVSMGKNLVYVIDPNDPGDCIPHQMVSVQTNAQMPEPKVELTSALEIEEPTVRARLIDWGLTCPIECVGQQRSALIEQYDEDFMQLFEEWKTTKEKPLTVDEELVMLAPWWYEAEFLGDFMLNTLGAYDNELKPLLPYTNMDSRLIDYYSLLSPLAAQLCFKMDDMPKCVIFFRWVRAFMGRLAMPWINNNRPLTDQDVLDSMKDVFSKSLTIKLFDEKGPKWQKKYAFTPLVHNRDKDTYIVILRKELDNFEQHLDKIQTIATFVKHNL